MLRSLVQSSRRVLVHNEWLAGQIRESHPGADIDAVDMGVPTPTPSAGARQRIRARHGIANDAVVFTAFGKVTPEKRLREALRASAAVARIARHAHLLIAGETVEYYDLRADAEALGIDHNVTFAGYVGDREIDDYLDASDVCLCMRWPTSRETSASWLRCIAAGRSTITTDLVHMADIPALDPRSWTVPMASENARPVTVAIDILDEDHSLDLAMRRLATDARLRETIGANARELWAERFTLTKMVEGYRESIEQALRTAAGARDTAGLPAHQRASGAEYAEASVREILGTEYHFRDAD
jgi:hypothetical protein